MSERARRLGANEALFRHVNERIREVGDRFGIGVTEPNFVCECADASCAELVALTLDEYELVHSEPTHFALRPGHEGQGVESVVARDERFVIVEKHSSESAAARETDPRA